MLKMSVEERKALRASSDAAWASAVAHSVLFNALDKAELKYVRSALKPVSHNVADTVYAEGDPPDAMYIVVNGVYLVTVQVHGGGRTLRMLGPGDTFGSCELVTDVPNGRRTCTVTCAEAGDVMTLSRRVVQAKLRRTAPPKKALIEQVQAQAPKKA